jgi:tight adherence protein C
VSRLLLLSLTLLGIGSLLLLMETKSFSRTPLLVRLKPYAQTTLKQEKRQVSTVETIYDFFISMFRDIADRLSYLFGVNESLSIRLDRINSKEDSTTIRTKQLAAVSATFVTAGAIALAFQIPPIPAGLLLFSLPLLAFLLIEQHYTNASTKWKRSLTKELPIVAEQIAMLLSAGYSLNASLARVADRGKGCTSVELNRVLTRVRHGIDEITALSEWEKRANVPAVSKLVSVLQLNRHATNLSSLVTEESRAIRRDAHRELIESIERRGQQVWIPVTIATLIPGSIFLVIPFLDAIRVFSGS